MKMFKKIRRGMNRFLARATNRAKKTGVYVVVMGGVMDGIANSPVAQFENISISNYTVLGFILGIGIITLSILIMRLMIKYYNQVQYNSGVESGLESGKEIGKEELLSEQEEEREEAETEAEDDEELEGKEDIDYDMVLDDIDKFTGTVGDEDKDQPIVQNINKFVTGYKFLKPPDVAVLSLTKRFDEYEVSIALPEKRKGASKISEFLPFENKSRKEIQDEFDATAQLNNSMINMPNMGGMGPIITSRLDKLGKKLSENFIPDNVMKNLQAIKDPIIIESNDGEILWEAIHDGNNFISLEHPMGRVLKTKEEARLNEFDRGKKLRFLMVCNPTGDLESTENEVEYIESILKQKVIINKLTREEATKDNILNAFNSGEYDVIHYAGHADSESEGEAALVAADGKLFSSEIKRALGGRPYVYLNACGSGRESMEESKDYTQLSDTEGLASSFILGGAIGFMGAMWPLPDKSAAEFSVNFYEGLIENLKVGEACRKARLEIKKQNPFDITWAAFLQYGDPVQRLREKKTEQDKEVETEDDLEEDAEIDVVDEDEYEKALEEEEGAKEAEVEEEAEEEMTEEERLKQYQGWIIGGLEHIKNKKYEDAITAYDSAIGLDPERYNAWHLTGNALRELRRYNEALECYDKAIERDATIDEVWYDKSLVLGGVGRFEEAMDCKKTMESLKIGRVKEWLTKANELMSHDGIRDALKIYVRILKENYKYPLAWYLKGIAHAKLGENNIALESYDNSIKFARNFSLSYHKKAELLFKMKRFDEALESINNALKLNPINENALMIKSEILIELKSHKMALDTINNILTINKSNADALLRKADILRQYNKNQKALEVYDQVIKLNPENHEAWFQRSQLIIKLGLDKEEELKCYRTLLDLDIDDPEILRTVGETLAKKEGIFEDKLKWFDKMILYNPNNAFAWENKGAILAEKEKLEEAFESYKKAVELDPKNIDVLFHIAVLNELFKNHEQTIDYYKRILKLDPNHIQALQNLSSLQLKSGEFQESLYGLKKLNKMAPNDVVILKNLRDIYLKLDQQKNALFYSKKIISLQPDDVDNQFEHIRLLFRYKNYPEVIKYSDNIIDKIHDNLEIQMMRAEAFSNENELDKALECWERIIELKTQKVSNKITIKSLLEQTDYRDETDTSPDDYFKPKEKESKTKINEENLSNDETEEHDTKDTMGED